MIFGYSETGAEPASCLDDQEDHLSPQTNELGGSDALGGSVEAPADDDDVMMASLIDGAAEKNMDMQLVAALAADAGRPKDSKDRGLHRRSVLGICGTQVRESEDAFAFVYIQIHIRACKSTHTHTHTHTQTHIHPCTNTPTIPCI